MTTNAYRRRLLRAGAAAGAAMAWPAAHAQAWPARPITMLVPSTPGGVVDLAARNVQPGLASALGQPVLVDNRPGAGGHIAAGTVAKAAPDGYTLLCSAGSILISGVVRNLSYAPMTDLVPVARFTLGSFLLLVPRDSPFHSLADLIAYGKANPGKLLFASSSIGNSTHIGGEMLSLMTGMKATHVPYKGNVQALTDLAAGRVNFSIDSRPPALPMIRSGRIRVLAVTAAAREADYPDLPAIAEQVPGYGIEGWVGLFAPRRTPLEVITRIAEGVRKSMDDPAVRQRILDSGAVPSFLGPEALARFMAMDHDRVSRVVREANITAD
ncbi:MAG TPA: tripartite tricarboxylate transporter substrate binding protein [Burkholderiaceae bacterium]|nr:tripartite tricarboxylate transporter substrate binding protein [Burkholderiaceae bacterium]